MQATTTTVRYALACLKELDSRSDRSLNVKALSHTVGAPYEECQLIADRLTQAGILKEDEAGLRVAKELEDITSLDLLQALWSKTSKPTVFRMLVKNPGHLSVKAARIAIAQADYIGAYPGDGGVAQTPQPKASSHGEERN